MFILLMMGCETRRFRNGTSPYKNGRYAISVEYLDNYIDISENGAYATRSEILRGKAYHELALKSYEKGNLALTTRFVLLANNTESDTLLAICYYRFAENAVEESNPQKAILYYDKIITEIPTSKFIPELYYKKMVFSQREDVSSYSTEWALYKTLYFEYPENRYELKARDIVSGFRKSYIEDALAGDLDEGLDKLYEIMEYPVGKKLDIYEATASIYVEKAEESITELEYFDADRFFKLALHYDKSLGEYIKKRLIDTAELYIVRGYQYSEERDFDKAFELFNKTFEVIPGYKKAINAIEETTRFIADIEEASGQYKQALRYETSSLRPLFPSMKRKLTRSEKIEYEIKRYEKILKLYRSAYTLDNLEKYSKCMVTTKNIIRSFKEPEKFALEVIKDYKHFIVNRAITEAREIVIANSGTAKVTDTGWEVMVSSGNYKYEVRYSVDNYTDKYLFKWLINLKNREITALNKISEVALEGILFKEEEKPEDENR